MHEIDSAEDNRKSETTEDQVLDFFMFAVNIVALVANMVFAIYRLTPRGQ